MMVIIPRAGCGADTVIRILQGNAELRLNPQPFGGQQDRIRFPARIIAFRNDGLEPIDETEGAKGVLHVFMTRRRGDRPRQQSIVQSVEQLSNPCLQAELQFGKLVKSRVRCRPEDVEIEPFSALLTECRAGCLNRYSYRG